MLRTFSFALSIVLFQLVLAHATVLAQQKDPPDRPIRPLNGVPEWLAKHSFRKKEFVFVRIQYSSTPGRRVRTTDRDWITDYPDADLNLSAQLRSLTTLKVDPKGKVLKLTADTLEMTDPFDIVCTFKRVEAKK